MGPNVSCTFVYEWDIPIVVLYLNRWYVTPMKGVDVYISHLSCILQQCVFVLCYVCYTCNYHHDESLEPFDFIIIMIIEM